MSIRFQILTPKQIHAVIPLVEELNDFKIPKHILKQRFNEMVTQHYECVGIYDNDVLIGCCGLWFCTRHYSGRSVEADHVFINKMYRGKGVGKQLFNWVDAYVKQKGVETIELNTYVQNTASHKFYYNEGYNILGFHFLKRY